VFVRKNNFLHFLLKNYSSGVVFFSATQKEVAIGIFADYGITGHRISYRLFNYRLQLKFIESYVPFWRTFAPIDTSVLGVFSQDSAFF
jgi:hypothetical protein